MDGAVPSGQAQSCCVNSVYVIARSSATKQSQSDRVVDCFATLAMTCGASPSWATGGSVKAEGLGDGSVVRETMAKLC